MKSELSLQVSEEYIDQCEKIVKRTDFESVESYIEFIVEEVVSESDLPTEEQQEVNEETSAQLESLGYL